jgi:hypothetical protein
MVGVPHLSLDRTMTWRRRVPLRVRRLAVAVPLTVLVVGAPTTNNPAPIKRPGSEGAEPLQE